MINITREKEVIYVKIDTGHGWTVSFNRTSSSELDAILLTNHLREKFMSRIATIKEAAYERGWNDKTKRKPKSDWQSGNIDKIDL